MPFTSARLWVAQAREDLEEFKARQHAAFSDKGAYSIFEDLHRKPGFKVVGIKIAKVPPTLSTKAANIVGALRSALDQATWRASVMLGVKEKTVIYFPLSGTKTDFDAMFGPKGRCQNIPVALQPFLRSTQGFPTTEGEDGGNDLLYSINVLAKSNKHTETYRVAVELAKAGRLMSQLDVIVEMAFPPVLDRAKNEAILFTTTPTGGGYANISFPVYIAFGEVPIIGGQPVIPILDKMAGMVDSIIDGIEAETSRLLRERTT
jgi:hypothetical protein